MKEDSAISCLSPSYKGFKVIVILGIFIYQGIPLLWFVLLWRYRWDLNPRGQSVQSASLIRAKESHLRPYSFLFSDYLPDKWYYEIYE